ncbi:MAG: hypothetical protein JRH18_01895 [Deltaproteobacteria bacterium]|nr:hypothetical protein [Deltaproteobacteria bacterium]MBW1959885.1 hypothetical protein [Deltaproteobacteria bacterium]MBW2150399.1 hypothetical protein [Deltaproteobacteria bacterium]
MKQKYVIKKQDDSELVIQEFAELDKDSMTLLCEEVYDKKKIESALKKNKESLIEALRTPNLYPAGIFAEKIADSVMALFESEDRNSLELFFDDYDYIAGGRKKPARIEQTEGETADITNLLEEEFEEGFDEKPAVDKLNSTIKVDEDDLTEFDEES